MARFDVYELADGARVLDCQADVFDGIGTRFVVPLARAGESAPTHPRLHPEFHVNGEPLIMMTEFAAAIRASELRTKIGSLEHEHFRIIGAIDVLTGSG
jgi:toxin CcdB